MNISCYQYKPKVYIAYKSNTSRYLAYIIYKTLVDEDMYDFFYDHLCMKSIEEWEELMDDNIDNSDIVLIVGEKGAFDSFLSKKCRDIFIKELTTALKKKKVVYYIPIENYVFWEDEAIKCGLNPIFKRLGKRHNKPIYFYKRTPEEFEEDLLKLKNDLKEFVTKHFKESIPVGRAVSLFDEKDRSINSDWERLSTPARQMHIMRQSTEFIPKKK